MDEMGPTVLWSRLGLKMRIDILHECFLAPRTHYEHIVLVNLAVKLFLAQAVNFSQEVVQFVVRGLFSCVRDHPIEHRSHPYPYLVPQVSLGQHAAATMASNPAHCVDITSRCDYK